MAAAPAQPSPLPFPDEVMGHIFRSAARGDVIRAAATSRRMRAIGMQLGFIAPSSSPPLAGLPLEVVEEIADVASPGAFAAVSKVADILQCLQAWLQRVGGAYNREWVAPAAPDEHVTPRYVWLADAWGASAVPGRGAASLGYLLCRAGEGASLARLGDLDHLAQPLTWADFPRSDPPVVSFNVPLHGALTVTMSLTLGDVVEGDGHALGRGLYLEEFGVHGVGVRMDAAAGALLGEGMLHLLAANVTFGSLDFQARGGTRPAIGMHEAAPMGRAGVLAAAREVVVYAAAMRYAFHDLRFAPPPTAQQVAAAPGVARAAGYAGSPGLLAVLQRVWASPGGGCLR